MIDPLDVLRARAEARAYLVTICELDLADAVDDLQHYAMQAGLVDRHGQDFVQSVISAAFAPTIAATELGAPS